MPGQDAEYEQQVDEKQQEEVTRSRGNSRNDDDRAAPGQEFGSPDALGFGNKLHFLLLSCMSLSLLLLIIITASASWGLSKKVGDKTTASLWEICDKQMGCFSWSDACSDGAGNVSGSAAFAIMSILLLAGMIGLEVMDLMKPGKLAFFPKLQMILSHVLWLFLLICWACFSGAKDTCSHLGLWYGWGWMFVLFMWLVHMMLAVVVTLKVLGKKLPCGL